MTAGRKNNLPRRRTNAGPAATYRVKGESTLAGADEADLLAAVARGDRAAFAALYDRSAAAVYRFCLCRLRDPEAAADACQETFAAVWLGAGGYAGSGAVLAWILGIARRKAADQGRRAAADPQPWEGETEVADPGYAVAAEEAVDVWSALRRLPEGQQEAVLLTYGLGLSGEEAAGVLGVPVGTVKSRLHAARAALAQALAPNGVGK